MVRGGRGRRGEERGMEAVGTLVLAGSSTGRTSPKAGQVVVPLPRDGPDKSAVRDRANGNVSGVLTYRVFREASTPPTPPQLAPPHALRRRVAPRPNGEAWRPIFQRVIVASV